MNEKKKKNVMLNQIKLIERELCKFQRKYSQLQKHLNKGKEDEENEYFTVQWS